LGQEARRFAEDNAKWGSEVPWRDGQQALHAAEVMLIVARRAGSLRSLNARSLIAIAQAAGPPCSCNEDRSGRGQREMTGACLKARCGPKKARRKPAIQRPRDVMRLA